jgi:hypothetical protein
MSRPKRRDNKITYTLEEVRDLAVEMSGGGDPDDFIPSDADIRLVRPAGKPVEIIIEWDDK